MSVIDANGRVFGRVNLVDAAVLVFLLLLIPVGYATFLLFRQSTPAIERVTRVDPTPEEHRIGGSQLMAKLKVTGSGLNPMLRAKIGNIEALGFVFENPNSADVLVGRLPPGRHDLVLYDGVHEVARAREAVEIVPNTATAIWVRLSGWLSNLDAQQAKQFDTGYQSPAGLNALRILAAGPVQPARSRVMAGTNAADVPVSGRFERPAELLIQCEASLPCVINGSPIRLEPPFAVNLSNGVLIHVEEIGPPADPREATVRVQVDAPGARVENGDRDQLTGGRAAEVIGITGGVSPIITLRLGADESREGWRYRGQLLTPGAPFRLRTARAVVAGHVLSVNIAAPGTPP